MQTLKSNHLTDRFRFCTPILADAYCILAAACTVVKVTISPQCIPCKHNLDSNPGQRDKQAAFTTCVFLAIQQPSPWFFSFIKADCLVLI